MGEPVYYHDYLDLDRLLSAQHPLSAANDEAHDEMLFIVVHQAYELWFKLILHELESVIEVFDQEAIRERAMGTLVSRLERINTVQRVMMDQLDVIETMTALDFLDFRETTITAAGSPRSIERPWLPRRRDPTSTMTSSTGSSARRSSR
jgi:tryptophan 2,3-dioxygenase